jgi:hypothetical protein
MQRPREFLEKDLLTAYDNACQDSYFHIPIGAGLKGIWLSPCPFPFPACPIAPSSLQLLYSLRKAGKLRRKEAYRLPDFMYENSI